MVKSWLGMMKNWLVGFDSCLFNFKDAEHKKTTKSSAESIDENIKDLTSATRYKELMELVSTGVKSARQNCQRKKF